MIAIRRVLAGLFLALLAFNGADASGKFNVVKHHVLPRTPAAAVTYDNSIGVGNVDSAGFANLPLNPGGTDGSDVATATPTALSANTTYNSGTRTLTVSLSTGLTATWASSVTPNTTYRVRITFNVTSSGGDFGFYVRDQNNVNLVTPRFVRTSPASGEVDALFTTNSTSTGLVLLSNTQIAGTVMIVGVTPHTGSLPGKRFYVNSATGSDARSNVQARDSSTPLATLAKAKLYVTPGAGDQILVAEGTSYTAGLPLLADESGFSALYPLVFQSYDPADPTNEAKFGRASGSNRPRLNTGANGANAVTNSFSTVSYLAFRGFKFDPGDVSGQSTDFTIGSAQTVSYVLFENNIFANQALSFDLQGYTAANGQHVIIRNNAQWGSWAASGHWEPLFASHVDSITLEDNVLYNGGWRVGSSRDDPTSTGGLIGDDIFRHAYYGQNTNFGTIYRRNFVINGPADCGHLLGDVVATENLMVDCPIALDMPGGANWPTTRPGGVNKTITYNAVIGSADLDSGQPRGFGFAGGISNTSAGSSIHHNLLIRVNGLGSSNRVAFSTMATLNTPSYMDVHDNVSYLRAASGNTKTEFTDKDLDDSGNPSANFHPLSILHTSYTNNVWDDPTDGSGNVNVGSVTFPNAYTDTSLYTAAGYANKQAMIDYAIAHPEAHPGRALYNLLMAGYGISHSI